MIKVYVLAAISFLLAMVGGLAGALRIKTLKQKIEIKDIEVNSAKEAARRLALAQAADHEALQNHQRRADDEINRAKRGHRDHFE